MVAEVKPIGFVKAGRIRPEDDFWGGEQSSIQLTDEYQADALAGLSEYSHVEIVFLFHAVAEKKVITGARHPRNNADWPAVGIFAQRAKNRPNLLGTTICALIRVEGTQITVKELNAIDGSPVLDIKPVMAEFLPRTPVRQPKWSHELMKQYWLLLSSRAQ